ncbi:MAG: T9SS type A sorting domain-containing protein, partial [Ignavibacteriota bacterium]
SDWDPNLPLGSHIDMLHQSPYSMGIAFDTLNRYWVFDGYHGCLFHYDFNRSHGYGGDDHSDGKILKYKEVKLKRIPNLPSHMIVDKSSGWLYIVDNGNNRIVRVDTKSGHTGNNLFAPDEDLLQYAEMTSVKYETVDSGFTNLSGITYYDGRLMVSNSGTGDIRVYNTTTAPKPTYLGTINTGDAGITGITIGPDSLIWYVNSAKETVVHLTPGAAAPAGVTLVSPDNFSKRNPISPTLSWSRAIGATNYHLQVSTKSDFTTTIYDSIGIIPTTGKANVTAALSSLDSGTMYYWRVSAKNSFGESGWSAVWSFTIVSIKPEQVRLLLPKDSAINVSTTPALVWSFAKNATGYELQLWDSLKQISDLSLLAQPSYSHPALPNGTRYSWRVRADNDGTLGEWSDTWTFTTLQPASVSQIKSPAGKLLITEIYPNPTSVNSTISFTNSEPISIRLAVYDQLGKELALVANELFAGGSHSLQFNTSSLPSGTYYYQFTTSDGVLLKPFIVQR